MAFDELLLADVKCGKFPPKELPEWLRVGPDGILERRATRDRGWKPFTEDDESVVSGMFFFPRNVCHYDGEGNYYLKADLYERYKDRLIPKHKGRLESFMRPEVVKAGQATGMLVITSNPLDYETYLWDNDDKVWRYAHTMRRVPKTHLLLDQVTLLYSRKSLIEVTPTASLGVLEELDAEHNRQIIEARKAKDK